MGLLDFLTGNKSDEIKDFKSRNAIIIDVRTVAEFKQGAISVSRNIPLQILNSKIDEIKKLNRPVIACCASGMRSANAVNVLKQNGIEAINGGGWSSLNKKL